MRIPTPLGTLLVFAALLMTMPTLARTLVDGPPAVEASGRLDTLDSSTGTAVIDGQRYVLPRGAPTGGARVGGTVRLILSSDGRTVMSMEPVVTQPVNNSRSTSSSAPATGDTVTNRGVLKR